MAPLPRTRRRPRIFYGWYIVIAHMAIHFYLSTVFIYGIGAFFNPIVVELGWSRTQFSIAAGLQRIEGSVASPLVGFLVDWIGPRRMVVFGVLLAGTGMMLLSRVQSLLTYYTAYVAVALGMSCIIGIPFTAAAANWFRRKRGRAMGWMFAGATFSGLFLPLVVFGIEGLGWRTTMLLCGAGILVVGLPAALVVRHRPEPYGYLPDGADPPVETEEGVPRRAWAPVLSGSTVKEALRTPAFWLLTLIFGLLALGPSAMFLHQIAYFESIGFSAATAATTVATFTLLSGIGRIGGGWLMDYVDHSLVLAGLISLNVLGFLVLLVTTHYWHTLAYALLFGVSFGGTIPARPIFTSALFGTRAFGAITGLMQSVALVGGALAPILMARIYDATGTYKPAIVLLAALIGAAIPLTFLLPKSQSRRTHP